MSRYVYGQPTAPAPVDPSQWSGLDMTWTGWDGSVWDITDPMGGVCLVRNGVQGLHFPRIEKFASESAAFPGRRLRGARAVSRDVLWPLYIWSSSSEDWIDRQDAFFRTIDPLREGVWTVKSKSRERTLRLTGVFDDDYSYDRDPYRDGHAMYVQAMEATQPYWQGALVVGGPWQVEAGQDFIPPGGGPPYYLSSGAAFGTATMTNPGDVDMHVTWVVDGYQGELESVVVGRAGSLITVPFTVAQGKMLRINTDPRNPSALLGDSWDPVGAADQSFDYAAAEDVSEALGLQSFAPIPPGQGVEVAVSAAGGGLIRAEGIPLFHRAF